MLKSAQRVLGAAVAWTAAQHLSYFASASLVTALAGAAAYGALGQALALALIGSLAITLRLDYAAQLTARDAMAKSLFCLAARASGVLGGITVLMALAAWVFFANAPAWLPSGALAVMPMALLQVLAARQVRQGNVARAAAFRAAPALLMLPLQAALGIWATPSAVVWSVPVAAWIVLAVVMVRVPATCKSSPSWHRNLRLVRSRWAFVRAEWPSLMLNTFSNHGQVLLVGVLADDTAAGAMALALRLAMLPTSLFGPALADALRTRVVAARHPALAGALVARVLPWLGTLSLVVHGLALALLPWVCKLFFAAQGDTLVEATRWLLLLGALRLAISPTTFLLAWRGWVTLNLAGQTALLLVALGSVVWGLPRGGVPSVAMAYTLMAAGIYVGYLVASLRALRGDN